MWLSEGSKQKMAGVAIVIAGIAVLFGIFGMYQGYKAGQFLNEVLYRDKAGNEVTRAWVLDFVGDNTLNTLLQNAEKAQKEQAAKPQAPAPTPEVK